MLDAQRALAAEDFSAVDGIRVRVAIHTGTADERDNDYFGPTVNRVARLLAVAHGGQVVLSASTTELVGSSLAGLASLRDLGEHRLKDLARPERVAQLVAPGLTLDFPPLRSLDVLSNNLPLNGTSFVARETEVAEITALLERHRLVTIVGAGGIGKTRTSLQVAANLVDGSGDGVWFVELAPLASEDYIPSTVAQALGQSLGSDADPLGALVRVLQSKLALLVFDNCEHLVEGVARAVAAILRGCPNVKILASSRQALGIAGEQSYRLPTLDISSSSALFVERAHAVDKRFRLTDENAPVIADIARRLDGIPLAIELAAARVKILSPRQIGERLDERFRVLTGGSRDVLPRQQTLRALIDWSHDLLDDRERQLFRRLAIFVNGFTLEGAVAVGSDPELDEFELVDVLSSLVDKSLLLSEPAGDAQRYRFLESTRVYAVEKLNAADERGACADRHLRYFRDRFTASQTNSERTAHWSVMFEDLAIELEDVRVALDWALAGPGVLFGAEIMCAIGTRWENISLEREGAARLEAFATKTPRDHADAIAKLWSAFAYLALNSGRTVRGVEAATEAVAYGRASHDPLVLKYTLNAFAMGAALSRRFDEADAALAEGEAIETTIRTHRLRQLVSRAFVSSLRGDLERAAGAFEQLRIEHRAAGDILNERMMTLNLAEVEHARGRTSRSIELVRGVLPVFQAERNRSAIANVQRNLAGYLVADGQIAAARATACDAIRELALDPEHSFVTMSIEHLALALALDGELARAAKLAGYADAAHRRHGYARESTESITYERLTALLAAELPAEELEAFLEQGGSFSAESAVVLALAESSYR
jgi:predicted ATPase